MAHHHHKHSSHPGEHAGHSHVHGIVDSTLVTTARGLWAIKRSCMGLLTTACVQLVVVALSGSVALLADTLHNFGDAATALPLWVAFTLARRRPSERFTYGLGRVEDLAGMAIVLIMAFSACVADYEAVTRLIHPEPVTHLRAVVVASVLGFLGNEAAALFRIRWEETSGALRLSPTGIMRGWMAGPVLRSSWVP
jgi:cation diffusion facilitator family transporter